MRRKLAGTSSTARQLDQVHKRASRALPPISIGGSAPAPVTVATWDYRGRPPGTHVYPALVELKSGSHWFYWTIETGSVEFLETHILKAKIEG